MNTSTLDLMKYLDQGVRCLSDARHYINRMCVLAVRGDKYSPLLTLGEVAADLSASGILLDGGGAR